MSAMCRRPPVECSTHVGDVGGGDAGELSGGGVDEHASSVRRIARRRRVGLFGIVVRLGTHLEIVDALGVADRMVPAGGLYPPQRRCRADGSDDEQPSPAEPYNLPLMLPQYPTENVLRPRLAELGQAPRFGHELTDFEHDGESVCVR
jgi:2-polyprenyl-6-methoxyphenol hydroxylase-like FAD-dependent oxidoreductase